MDNFIELFDPFPMAALFAVFIAGGLLFVFGLEALVHRRVHPDVRESREHQHRSDDPGARGLLFGPRGIRDRGRARHNQRCQRPRLGRRGRDVGSVPRRPGFPPPHRERIHQAILAYDRSELANDFHAVERTDKPSPVTEGKLAELYGVLQASGSEAGNSSFYRQAVSDLADITKARRCRNADATDTIPGPLFFLVVLVSVLVLAVATLLNTRERGTHVARLAGLAVVMSLNPALIVALEHPFGGAIAVTNEPLRVGVLAPAAG